MKSEAGKKTGVDERYSNLESFERHCISREPEYRLNLRFLHKKDGSKVLQYAVYRDYEGYEMKWFEGLHSYTRIIPEWRDVPLVSEESK